MITVQWHNPKFIKAVVLPEQLPPPKSLEVIFAGRSNVGKSSLINALTRHPIAKTSSKPGKTRQLLFFDLGHHATLVDMPGYGYAARSKAEQAQWDHLIASYFQQKRRHRCLVILIDSRHPPKPTDFEMLNYAQHYSIPAVIVLTKADKLSQRQQQQQHQAIEAELGQPAILSNYKNTKAHKAIKTAILQTMEQAHG